MLDTSVTSIYKHIPHRLNRSNTVEFVSKAKAVHGDRYDYSKVEYINKKNKITIICNLHGEFKQTPNSHLQGHGCKSCAVLKHKFNVTSSTNKFIQKAKAVHGDRYDYSLADYKNSSIKVIIICRIHGEFEQRPCNHFCQIPHLF